MAVVARLGMIECLSGVSDTVNGRLQAPFRLALANMSQGPLSPWRSCQTTYTFPPRPAAIAGKPPRVPGIGPLLQKVVPSTRRP